MRTGYAPRIEYLPPEEQERYRKYAAGEMTIHELCDGRVVRVQQEEDMQRRTKERAPLSIPEKHQLRVAKDTLRTPDAILGVLGGPSKAEARQTIIRLTGKPPIDC